MTTLARSQDGRKSLPLIAQVTMAERRILDRHRVIRVRLSLLRRRLGDELIPLLLLSGAGLGFITGNLTAQGAPTRTPGLEGSPADSILMRAAGTLFPVVRAALAVLPLAMARRDES